MITIYVLWIFQFYGGAMSPGSWVAKSDCVATGEAIVKALEPWDAKYICISKDVRK